MTGIEQLSQQFEKELTSARSVVIGTHLNPDGDALGSALAVSHWLDARGVQNEVLCHHKAPRTLEFLPGVENIRQVPKYDSHDLAVVLDLDPLDRLGTTGEYILKAPRMVVVDHHVPHNAPGDFRVIDVQAPATALILTRMFLELGVDITPEIALCLLCGIVTDTGSFRFPNTTPESLSLSAILLERGGDINLINEEVFQKKPYEAVKLYGQMLDTINLECDNQNGWSWLNLRLLDIDR